MFGPYRRLGANLPLTDPSGYHGVALEGWFWRFVTRSGEVVVVIAAVCRGRDGARWGMASVGAQGTVVHGQADEVSTFETNADVRIGGLLTGDDRRLRVRLPGAQVDVAFADRRPFGGRWFGGMGPAQVVPGLSQYWHPHLPHARVTSGRVAVAGRDELDLSGADAYAEKNWGAGGMPERWWWGQAHVGDDRTNVCFAGGRAGVGPLKVGATALVVGDHRWVAPLQPLRIDVTDQRWAFVARGPRTRVEVEGTVDPQYDPTLLLPVPDVPARRVKEGHSPQHLTGRLRVEVRRRGVVQLSAETARAGLELGRG